MKESIEERLTQRSKFVLQTYEPTCPNDAWSEFEKLAFPRMKWWQKRSYWICSILVVLCLGLGHLIITSDSHSKEIKHNTTISQTNDSDAINSDFISEKSSSKLTKTKAHTSNSSHNNERNQPGVNDESTISSISQPSKQKITSPSIERKPGNTTPENAIIDHSSEQIQQDNQWIEANSNNENTATNENKHEEFIDWNLLPLLYPPVEIPSTFLPNSESLTSLKYEVRKEKVESATNRTSKPSKKFHLDLKMPDLPSFKNTQGNKYSKFVGPNKIALIFDMEKHTDTRIGDLGQIVGKGFEIEGPITSKLLLSIGAIYKKQSHTIFYDSVQTKWPSHLIDLSSIPNELQNFQETGSIDYFEIPIQLKAMLIDQAKFRMYISGGMSTVMPMKQIFTVESTMDSTIVGSYNSGKFEKMVWLANLNAGIGARAELFPRCELELGAARYFPMSNIGFGNFSWKRWNYHAALFYRFGRKD